jgi:dihydrofolate reductase
VANLIYTAITSLDGYVADERGNFDWAAPDEELHAFVNDLERSHGTYLYGRRLYDVMAYWETAPGVDSPGRPPSVVEDYATLWRAAEKVVFSTTLARASTAKTRLERHFDTDAVRALKTSAERDLSVGGPTLAGQALKAGLVDEVRLFLMPVVVGGLREASRALPADLRLKLELLDEHRFGSGVVYLRYGTTG